MQAHVIRYTSFLCRSCAVLSTLPNLPGNVKRFFLFFFLAVFSCFTTQRGKHLSLSSFFLTLPKVFQLVKSFFHLLNFFLSWKDSAFLLVGLCDLFALSLKTPCQKAFSLSRKIFPFFLFSWESFSCIPFSRGRVTDSSVPVKSTLPTLPDTVNKNFYFS